MFYFIQMLEKGTPYSFCEKKITYTFTSPFPLSFYIDKTTALNLFLTGMLVNYCFSLSLISILACPMVASMPLLKS